MAGESARIHQLDRQVIDLCTNVIPEALATPNPQHYMTEKFKEIDRNDLNALAKALRELYLCNDNAVSHTYARIDSVAMYTYNQVLPFAHQLFRQNPDRQVCLKLSDIRRVTSEARVLGAELTPASQYADALIRINNEVLSSFLIHDGCDTIHNGKLVVESIYFGTLSNAVLMVIKDLEGKNFDSVYDFIRFCADKAYHYALTHCDGFVCNSLRVQFPTRIEKSGVWTVVKQPTMTADLFRFSQVVIAENASKKMIELIVPLPENGHQVMPMPVTITNYPTVKILYHSMITSLAVYNEHDNILRRLQMASVENLPDLENKSECKRYIERFIKVVSVSMMSTEVAGEVKVQWLLLKNVVSDVTVKTLMEMLCPICQYCVIPEIPEERPGKILSIPFFCHHIMCKDCFSSDNVIVCPQCKTSIRRQNRRGKESRAKFSSNVLLEILRQDAQKQEELVAWDVEKSRTRARQERERIEKEEQQKRDQEERSRQDEESSQAYARMIQQRCGEGVPYSKHQSCKARAEDVRVIAQRKTTATKTRSCMLLVPDGVNLHSSFDKYFKDVYYDKTKKQAITISFNIEDCLHQTEIFKFLCRILELTHAYIRIHEGYYAYDLKTDVNDTPFSNYSSALVKKASLDRCDVLQRMFGHVFDFTQFIETTNAALNDRNDAWESVKTAYEIFIRDSHMSKTITVSQTIKKTTHGTYSDDGQYLGIDADDVTFGSSGGDGGDGDGGGDDAGASGD
jgi:hypothetical protein